MHHNTKPNIQMSHNWVGASVEQLYILTVLLSGWLNFIFVFKNLLTWGSPQLERSVLNSETWEERRVILRWLQLNYLNNSTSSLAGGGGRFKENLKIAKLGVIDYNLQKIFWMFPSAPASRMAHSKTKSHYKRTPGMSTSHLVRSQRNKIHFIAE